MYSPEVAVQCSSNLWSDEYRCILTVTYFWEIQGANNVYPMWRSFKQYSVPVNNFKFLSALAMMQEEYEGMAEAGLCKLEDAIAILQGQSYYLAADPALKQALQDRRYVSHNQVKLWSLAMDIHAWKFAPLRACTIISNQHKSIFCLDLTRCWWENWVPHFR